MKNLNDNIKKLFSVYEGALNSKVVKAEAQKTTDGVTFYEAPVATLTSGGATVIIDGKPRAISLEAPARAEFSIKKVHPHQVVYRVAFDITDAAKADEDESYFNKLVAPVLKEAITRYEGTFGGSNVIRYGKYFCQIDDVKDNGEFVEFRLIGDWASDKTLEQA